MAKSGQENIYIYYYICNIYNNMYVIIYIYMSMHTHAHTL